MEADIVSETSDKNSTLAQLIALEGFIGDNFLNYQAPKQHSVLWSQVDSDTANSCRENYETGADMSRTLWMMFRKYATAEKRAAMINLTELSGSQKYGIPFL
jgi:hypothetical protein